MPKQALTINDFSGGLITDTSPRDLEGNQLQVCENVDPSSKGRLKIAHAFADDDANIADMPASGAVGYGLFVFSNDAEVSGGGVNAGGDFLASSDAATVDIQELIDRDVTATDKLGTTAVKASFYTAEGDLYVGGTNNNSTAFTSPTKLVYHKQAKQGRAVAAWQTAGALGQYTKPTNAAGATAPYGVLIHANDSSDDGSDGATDNTVFSSTEADNLHFVLNFGAVGTGGFNNNHTSASAGEQMEFAASLLYKNKAESGLTICTDGDSLTDWYHDHAPVINASLSVHAYYGAALTSASDYIYGARLYSRQNGEQEWYLLAEVDMEKGIRGSLETKWNDWENITASHGHPAAAGGIQCTSEAIHDPPALLTFKTLNGFEYTSRAELGDSTEGRVYFKHAVVANSRTYIGNVEIDGRTYGDRILKSAVGVDSAGIPNFQFDVFTETSFLDVAVNDGDEITALAVYADRILEFKKKSLYIINISKESEFIEDFRQGAGVSQPGAIAKTPFGIAWANTTGCFLYDGENISQLHMGKIADETTGGSGYLKGWDNVTEFALVGYDVPSRQLVVLWDGRATGTSNNDGDAFIYTLDTQSWHYTSDVIDQANNVSNMVNISTGGLIIKGGSATDELSRYRAREASTTYPSDDGDADGESTIAMQTGELSFGDPGMKKNLTSIMVRYKYGGANLTVSLMYAPGTILSLSALGYLDDVSTSSYVEKTYDLTALTAYSKNKYWFGIKISGLADYRFELDEIVLTYRTLGVR